jgi:asparagine synthase (glutamine-hydrolysing)
MCGICGVYDARHRVKPVVQMNQIQRHRGPDDEGYVFINTQNGDWKPARGVDTAGNLDLAPAESIAEEMYNLALGNRRLAILDLSSAGHMPMIYGNGNLCITHNGEIYNYREIGVELRNLGYQFNSDTDTEVILAAYTEWGVECLKRFNGMFAFVIYDRQKNTLFCARDRFGIKPFYYYWQDGAFVFGSEIKVLLQHPAITPCENDQVLFDYLVLGLSDHNDETFFQGVQSLTPGHYLLLDLSDHRLTKTCWWDVDINPSLEKPSKAAEAEAYARFSSLFEDSIRLRLRSDVPVGSALSGGLDSSAIVTLANRLLTEEQVIPRHLVGEHQKTFTARYSDAVIDEYQYSNRIVRQTGAEEHVIFPSPAVLWSEIENFVWHLDQPVNSTSQYAQWNVMKLARQQNVTVLLDGQGGDEVLAGYYQYLPYYMAQVQQQLGALKAIQTGIDVTRVGGSSAALMLLWNSSFRLPWRVQKMISFFQSRWAVPGSGGSGLQGHQIAPEFFRRNYDRRWQPMKSVDANGLVGVLYRDLTSTNLPKLLRYEDRNSMAFSIETRLPFLDYRLVEFVFSLPMYYRINQGWTKWILRRSLQNVLPKEVCWRRTKLGFPTPEKSWMIHGEAKVRNILSRNIDRLGNYIRPEVIKETCGLPTEQMAETPGLWRMINQALWFEQFFGK